jgi:hypothetical protein
VLDVGSNRFSEYTGYFLTKNVKEIL